MIDQGTVAEVNGGEPKADKAELELAAMSAVRKLLADLQDDSRQRVFDWVADYFGYAGRRKPGSPPPEPNPPPGGGGGNLNQFADFAALYHAANPLTEADGALVGGYWFQVAQGRDTKDFGSAEVNKELNQLGFGIGNITARINDLINQTPVLVIQLRKSGKAQQARKRYRVTDQGIRRVQAMLATRNAASEE